MKRILGCELKFLWLSMCGLILHPGVHAQTCSGGMQSTPGSPGITIDSTSLGDNFRYPSSGVVTINYTPWSASGGNPQCYWGSSVAVVLDDGLTVPATNIPNSNTNRSGCQNLVYLSEVPFWGTLCANVLETLTPIEFSVEGGEAEEHGVPEGVGLRG
jgi:hypothetical protein